MTVNRSAVGKRSKRKGSNRERWVAKKLAEWWGTKFVRTPMSGGSALAEDYRLAGDVATKDPAFPFHVEIKNRENWELSQLFTSNKCGPWKWWEQTTRQALDDDEPLMLFKRNNRPMWVMMEKAYFDEAFKGKRKRITTFMQLTDPDEFPVIIFLFDDFLSTDTKMWRRESEG